MRKCGPRSGFSVAAVAAVWLLASAFPHAQFEKTLSTTYDGWTKLPDGSFELVFGYMNRNSADVDVPLGAANQLEPAPEDHGQPSLEVPVGDVDVGVAQPCVGVADQDLALTGAVQVELLDLDRLAELVDNCGLGLHPCSSIAV